jgi:outer membrane protein TolC
MSANANIGVAKAAYFPSISLTGTAGFESYSLSKLFTGSAGLWNTAASLTQPVFQAGALRSGTRLVQAQEDQLLLTYKQTIIGAFQQVSDGLVAYQKIANSASSRSYSRPPQEMLTGFRKSCIRTGVRVTCRCSQAKQTTS